MLPCGPFPRCGGFLVMLPVHRRTLTPLPPKRGEARHFLNAEPQQAVQSALNGKNPVNDLQELSRLVAGDPDAKSGLQRAVADYLMQRVVRAPAQGAAT